MKRLLLLAFVAMATVTNGWGQHPDPFVPDNLDEDFYSFIRTPPAVTSGEFAYDFYHYQYGRELRELDGVSEQALSDEAAKLYDVFNKDVIGIDLNEETTPENILLCERAVSDVHKSNKTVKKKYQRIRPFATFHEPSLKPEEDEEVAKTFSYPSGHSSRGYMYALVLCTVMPEKTTQIMRRAQQYAYNRVICGHHWKSDTDASLVLASTMFAYIVCTDAYQAQLAKARAEYQALKGESTAVRALDATRKQSVRIYHINGTPTDETTRGIVIENGQKHVAR